MKQWLKILSALYKGGHVVNIYGKRFEMLTGESQSWLWNLYRWGILKREKRVIGGRRQFVYSFTKKAYYVLEGKGVIDAKKT